MLLFLPQKACQASSSVDFVVSRAPDAIFKVNTSCGAVGIHFLFFGLLSPTII